VQKSLTGTSSTRIEKPEPKPLKCKHCGAVLRYKKKVMFGGRYVTWFAPDLCNCPGAVEEAKAEAERAKREAEKAEAEKKRQERARLLRKSGLPARYHDATFNSAKITKFNRQAFDRTVEYAQNPKGGLLISGPVGTGKTYLAACIVNAFLDQLKWVTFGGVVDLLGRIRRSYSEAAQEEEWQIMDELCSVPLLVLDDLGKEKVSEWVEQMLFRVIDSRYRENKLLVVTSNFTAPELQDRYPEVGPALVSRLAEMCTGIYLGGKDWRMMWLEKNDPMSEPANHFLLKNKG